MARKLFFSFAVSASLIYVLTLTCTYKCEYRSLILAHSTIDFDKPRLSPSTKRKAHGHQDIQSDFRCHRGGVETAGPLGNERRVYRIPDLDPTSRQGQHGVDRNRPARQRQRIDRESEEERTCLKRPPFPLEYHQTRLKISLIEETLARPILSPLPACTPTSA